MAFLCNAGDNRLPDLDRPVGVPAAYADHARLMFDLQALAFGGYHQSDYLSNRPRNHTRTYTGKKTLCLLGGGLQVKMFDFHVSRLT